MVNVTVVWREAGSRRKRISLGRAAFLLAGLCCHGVASAQSDCEPNPFTVDEEVGQWAADAGIAVPPAVKTQLAAQFCDAAFRVISAHQYLSVARMNELKAYALEEYLNGQLGPDSGPSLAAILSGALSISGFSRPVGKRYGRLEIDYRADVDAVTLGGEPMSPADSVVVPLGTVEIGGQRGGDVVCEASVEVVAGQSARVEC